jgi:putative transcription factor
MSIAHQDWDPIYFKLDKYKTDKKKETLSLKKGPSNNLDKTDIDTFKNKKIDEKFSVKIRNARNSKKMSQKELAQRINVKPGVINDYESGKALPNPNTINKIKKTLGI